MLKTKVVDDLRNDWNEKAASMFMLAAAAPDEQKERIRGAAEQLALCAAELRKAQE